jgi:hypothetical protein
MTSSHSLTQYMHHLTCALTEVVPALHFHACVLSDDYPGPERITVFGMDPDGAVRGGYALESDHPGRDLFQDTLTVARFFLRHTDDPEPCFHPPALKACWMVSRLQNGLA